MPYLVAALDAARQLKQKQVDNGVDLATQDGLPQKSPSRLFENTGPVYPEFAEATRTNPDTFADIKNRLYAFENRNASASQPSQA